MRDKKNNITLPFKKAENVLNSPAQLVRIMDDETREWTGISINKADIVKTEPDLEKEKEEREKEEARYRLENPEIEKELTLEEKQKQDEAWKKLREDVEGMGIIKKIN